MKIESLTKRLVPRKLKRQKTKQTPIWVMRQAGRYLPQYRAVRKKLILFRCAKLQTSEVTIQPVDLIGVDVAIIFSDILVIPEAMGLEFLMNEETVMFSRIQSERLQTSTEYMNLTRLTD